MDKLNEQIARMRSILNLDEKAVPKAIQQQVGNVLFGSNPQIAGIQHKEPETNTPLETNLLKNLKSWTQSSTDQSAAKVISTVADLVKLKQYFPEVLNPPYGASVYRGTSIKLPTLSAWLKQNPEFEKLGDGHYLKFKTPYPYKPTRDVSSWTASFHYSTSFRGKEFESAVNVGVVFETKVDDSFIMNPQVMNIIFKHTQGDLGYEQEVVRDEDEVIKFEASGEYYLILSACEYKIFNPSYDYDCPDDEV
jgi:hypothetical protein